MTKPAPRHAPHRLAAFLAAAALTSAASPAEAQTLRGSSASLDAQNAQAAAHDFTYIATAGQVRRFVAAGYLVAVPGNADYELHQTSFPYTRPEVLTFIERLSRQYRAACGEKLVVTSLTRPQSRQPPNASARSVHPTGMAVDLRRSNRPACRTWLERTLLSLEGAGVINATHERRPPHYHVAVFPNPYSQYVTRMAEAGTRGDEAGRATPGSALAYQVRRGDSLWTIARAHGTTVDDLRRENELRSSRIYAGQTLRVPVADAQVATQVAR